MKRLGVLALMMLWCATVHGQTQHDRINSRQSSNPGGSGSPNGNTGDMQIRNGANVTAGGMNDNGVLLSAVRDSQFKDPNPYVDVRAYGVRYTFLGQTIQSTCTATTGRAVVTTGAKMALVNGDGFTCAGAGPASSMSTPAAPTVTSSGAQTTIGTGHLVANSLGRTTYHYQIVAVDIKHGMTQASPVGRTTTGAATLGATTVKVASWTRVDDGNGYSSTLTITTSAPHAIVAGMGVGINGGSGLEINNASGRVLAVPDTRHFTLQDNRTVANGALPSGTTGATVFYTLGNKITWAAVTGAFRYLIYRGSTLIGISYPENTTTGALTNDPLKDSFEDYGAQTTLPSPPPWAPTSPPKAATNQDLTTTVSSGAGTTTLTLAATAINSTVGSIAALDNTPNFISAVNSVCGGINWNTLFFPETVTGNFGSYQFYSIPFVNCNIAVIQQGQVNFQDTLYLNGGVMWTGQWHSPHNGQQFGWSRHPSMTTSTAYPLIYQLGSNPIFELRDMNFIHNASNGAQIIVKDTGGIPAGIVRDCQFSTGLGGNDYTSTEFVWRNNISGGADIVFENTSMIVGTGPGAPIWQTTGGGDPYTMRNMFFTKRGIFIGGSFGFHGDNIYEQQALGAKLVLWTSNAGINPVGVVLTHSIEDTTSSAVISYGSASGATLTGQIYYEGNTHAGAVSGNGSVSVLGKSVTGFLQNSLLSNLSDNVSVEDGVVSTNAPVFNVVQNRYSISERVGPTNQFFVGAVPPSKPTCTAVAGGTAPNATYTVSVVPVFRTGENKTGQGMMSPPCDGATINTGVRPGVQTIQISWKAVIGAIGYDLYAGNTHNGISCASPLVPGGGSGIVTYNWTKGITGGCTGQTQTEDGSGPSNMTTSGIAANNLRMSNNLTATITPGVMSANRTQTLPDASGTFVLDTTIAPLIRATAQQSFDNFNRANGATAVTQNIASGTATLGTGAIASATCASVVTVAGKGIATTDTLTWSFNADPSATTGYAPAAGGSLYILAYPTANNANFKVCNSSAGSITPGAATLNWKVAR